MGKVKALWQDKMDDICTEYEEGFIQEKEADLIAASLIGQGVEFLGTPEETIDFYREYLITEGVIEVEPETKH